MKSDNIFTIYRSPLTFKTGHDAKMFSSKGSSPNIKAACSHFNHLSNSHYRISQKTKLCSPRPSSSLQRQRSVKGYSSTLKIRASSAGYHSSKVNKRAEIVQQEDINYKPKTCQPLFTKSASTKDIKSRSSLGFLNHNHPLLHVERKFIITVVDLGKEKEKGRKLMDERLQNFNYKTVLGDNLPFKKIPKLIIDEHGVVSRQHF